MESEKNLVKKLKQTVGNGLLATISLCAIGTGVYFIKDARALDDQTSSFIFSMMGGSSIILGSMVGLAYIPHTFKNIYEILKGNYDYKEFEPVTMD